MAAAALIAHHGTIRYDPGVGSLVDLLPRTYCHEPTATKGAKIVKTIRNMTPLPVRVPLPRGKVLHLGARKTGEISAKAVDHPPLVKLVESGEIEILGDGEQASFGPASSKARGISTHGHTPGALNTQHGDR